MDYPFKSIEKKWQKIWEDKRIFYVSESSEKPKYYILSMFPYASGVLHMGHISNYSISDALVRYKIMNGYNVLQPMGYDAFGLPAENYAIENNSHPRITTENNAKIMDEQFKQVGFGYDWNRKISTCEPEYYKWNQWFFLKMYEKGLVYRKKSYVNWCPDCRTVLANEQVEDGKCWRCGTEVSQKEMEQWFIKITNYAEELLDQSQLQYWPERVKIMQKNWIGKSYGTEIFFKMVDSGERIDVFTTRADTIFGCTYIVLAPEHPLVHKLIQNNSYKGKIEKFIHRVINESKIVRSAEDNVKEGIFTGQYAINPVNNENVPIYIANYVLMEYGTGAIMAVPAHDQRDFEFAKKYNLPMKIVIQNKDRTLDLKTMTSAYVEEGVLVNSAQFDGMNNIKAIKSISEWMESEKIGKMTISYRLRDWGISRQRYWGTPIPIIRCPKCGDVPVPEKDLPVELPFNVEVGKTRQNPLKSVPEFVHTTCPKCGGYAERETDTMDTFFDSSWYYVRYADPHNHNMPFDSKKANYWVPVDQYIGGIEHATMHLLYVRFFHKFMRDLGMVNSDEPCIRLLTQGMVTKDGAKMSKSKGNVVDPQYIIDQYGADTVRVFMLFSSPPDKDKEWKDESVKGASRFLNRVWRLIDEQKDFLKSVHQDYDKNANISSELKKLRYSTHFTIKKVTEDIEERMQFNTAIAAIMQHLNNIQSYYIIDENDLTEIAIYKEAIEIIPYLLVPFAPHISEELWQMLGHKKILLETEWPKYEPEFLKTEEITYVIQINGKLRSKITVSADSDEDLVKEKALANYKIQKYITGKEIIKIIVVPNKLVNIVSK